MQLQYFVNLLLFSFQILVTLANITGKDSLLLKKMLLVQAVSLTSDVLGQQMVMFLLYNQEHIMYDSVDAGFRIILH